MFASRSPAPRDRPVRIEACGLLFLFLRKKEEVDRPNAEHDRDTDADVRADHRFFFVGDSAAVHEIAINAIESEIGRVRQDGSVGRLYQPDWRFTETSYSFLRNLWTFELNEAVGEV